MTLKTFSTKIHPVNSFLRFTFRKQTPLTLLVAAFAVILCPGALIRSVIECTSYGYTYYFKDVFCELSVLVFGLALAMLFVLLMLNFSFLYSKKSGDMFHSLPITRKGMLFTRSFTSYIGALFLMTLPYLGLCAVNFMDKVEGVAPILLLKTYLLMVFFLLVAASFCLLFVVCSGGAFDCVVALGAINLLPLALIALVLLFAEDHAVGVYMNYNILIYASPLVYMVYMLGSFTLPQGNYTTDVISDLSPWAIAGLSVFAILCTVASAKLFKIRKSETAGEAYSFKFVPVIITLLVSMTGGYLLGLLFSNEEYGSPLFWIFLVIGALLCAVAYGAIASRGFKKIKGSLIKGGISVALVIIMLIVSVVGVNIVEKRIPKENNIKKIYLGYDHSICITEDFDRVISVHEKFVEGIDSGDVHDYSGYSDVLGNLGSMYITYVMKDGSVCQRDYSLSSVSAANMRKDLLVLLQSDEVLNRYDGMQIVDDDGYGTVEEFFQKDGVDMYSAAEMNQAQIEELLDIFRKEMLAADESIFDADCRSVCIWGYNSFDITVPETFTETIAYLDRFCEAEE